MALVHGVVGLGGVGGGAGAGEGVDHAAVEGDGLGEDAVEEVRVLGVAEGVDAAFREGEVDGFGEIEGRGGGVAEVCGGGGV